jgi:hypothetical protein
MKIELRISTIETYEMETMVKEEKECGGFSLID